MKNKQTLRNAIIAMVLGLTFTSMGHAQILTNDPAFSGYFSNPTGQQYSSGVIYAQVILDDSTPITNAGSELALFDGTNCAGYAEIQSGSAPGGLEFFLTAHANVTPGATMTYEFWNSATGFLYTTNIATTYNFQSLVGAGTITAPITLHATAAIPEPSTNVLIVISLAFGVAVLYGRKRSKPIN